MKTASWIILVVVGALTLLGSLFSVGVAYVSVLEDKIGPASSSRAIGWEAGGGDGGAGKTGNGGGLRSRVCDALPGHHPRPLPPRRCVGVVGAIGWHAGRVGADPAPSPLPRHQSGGARGGHRGGHGTFDSRSVGSGGTRPGSRRGSLEGQQSSGLRQRRNVSIHSVSHPRLPNSRLTESR